VGMVWGDGGVGRWQRVANGDGVGRGDGDAVGRRCRVGPMVARCGDAGRREWQEEESMGNRRKVRRITSAQPSVVDMHAKEG
jgi:hypothetical protein